jgi:cytoskeleton protein RodZ
VLVGGLVLLAIAALATWSIRTGDPQPVASDPAAVEPAVPPPAASPPPVAAPSPAETELTTIRPVWVRVIADGERVVERELPADARVPLKAGKTIVIRTGDAGAVRLSIAGRDQGFLGRDGEVVTRTFAVGEPEPR